LGLLLSGNAYAEMTDPFKKFLSNKRDIKFYKGWIPEENVKPNYDTLVMSFIDLLNNK
jgi:hypothetical protein